MNYQTVVNWDPNVIDVCFMDADTAPTIVAGLAYEGKYIVSGIPATPSGRWISSAKIYNTVDGTWYINIGSTASPSWALVDTGSGFGLPAVLTDTTTTNGVSFDIQEPTLTDGFATRINAPIMQNGIMMLLQAPNIANGGFYIASSGAASMTNAGAYFNAQTNHGTVFNVGVNGHITTGQFTPPTIVVGTSNGITAAAIATGSTDTAGVITTTGRVNSMGDATLVVTFNVAYLSAPKVVQLQAQNGGGAISQTYVIPSSTGFTIDILSSISGGTNPSFSYLVIA